MKRERLDIRDWEAFTTLVRLRHFGHAADELGITQSAVSQRISRLETDLKLKLLTRSNQGVEPTSEGIAILPEARALIAAKRNALEAASRIRENGARPVRILLSNAIIHSSLVPKIRRSLETEPDHEFCVDVASADEIESFLLSGEYDLAITTLAMTRGGFEEHLLTELPMAVAVPDNVKHRAVTMEMLCQQPVLTVARHTEPYLYDRLISDAVKADQVLQIDQSVVSFPSILAMVSMGKGWGIVPLAMAGAVPDGLTVLPLKTASPPAIRIFVAWSSTNSRAGKTAELLLKNGLLND